MGDANPKLNHQKKASRPTTFEYLKFIAELVFSAILLVMSVYAIFLMQTNPFRYQDVIRRFYESAGRESTLIRLLGHIPPNITPLVTWASGVSFTLVSTIYSALVIAVAIFGLAGFLIGYVIWKRPVKRPHVPSVDREKLVPKS